MYLLSDMSYKLDDSVNITQKLLTTYVSMNLFNKKRTNFCNLLNK